MQIPAQTKKKKPIPIKEIETFDKFYKQLTTAPHEESIQIYSNYIRAVNNTSRTTQSAIASTKQLEMAILEHTKTNLHTMLEKKTKFKKPTKFTLETIKELEHVKKAEIKNNKLIITTKQQKFDTYIARDKNWTAPFTWEIPAYKITYEIKKINQTLYDTEIPEEFKIEIPKIKTKLSINFVKKEDKIMLNQYKKILKNDHYYTTDCYNIGFTPYAESWEDMPTIIQKGGISKICFGNTSAIQENLLEKCDIFPHLFNLLKTLYTTDQTGHGYTKWLKLFIRKEKITKTLKLYKQIGNFEGEWILYKPSSSSIPQKIILNNDKDQILLPKTKELIKKINNDINEKNTDYEISEQSTIRVTEIILAPIHTFQEKNEIKSIIFQIILANKKTKIDETTANIEINITDKKEAKLITKIKTPKKEMTINKFNSIIKNIYEVNITL